MVMKVRGMDLFAMGQALCRQQWVWNKDKNKYVEDEPETKQNQAEWEAYIRLPCVYDLEPPKQQQGGGAGQPAQPQPGPEPLKPDLTRIEKPDSRVLSGALAANGDLDTLRKDKGLQPFGAHAVFNTTTSVGFSAELLRGALRSDPKDKRVRMKALDAALAAAGFDGKEKKDLCLVRRWMAKAGHDETAIKALGCDNRVMLTLGREDFVCPCNVTDDEPVELDRMTSKELVRLVAESILGLDGARSGSGTTEPAAGLLAGRSTIGVLRPETRELPDKECAAHASANDVREHFAFKWSEIVGIRDAMRKLWIPKVIEERVLNSLALFNEGIKDNFLFSSFLELRGYLDRICQTILGPAGLPPSRGGVSPDYWAEQLGKMLDQFEAGWRNRTHGGWRLGEVSDFNFEFKGGIQQLVSAFHGATQKLMWHFTGLNDALAVVTGKPGI
jgi:hypothetical protein